MCASTTARSADADRVPPPLYPRREQRASGHHPRLVDYAWGYDGGDGTLLKTHVSHIRKKLQLPQGELGEIRAIPRVGYRLTRSAAS
jgi:DNA-binding response OmpR family regulator